MSQLFSQFENAPLPRCTAPAFDIVFHCSGGSLAANKVHIYISKKIILKILIFFIYIF
jgi:hypothetical protein